MIIYDYICKYEIKIDIIMAENNYDYSLFSQEL